MKPEQLEIINRPINHVLECYGGKIVISAFYVGRRCSKVRKSILKNFNSSVSKSLSPSDPKRQLI